jgi:hypothetical protein
MSRRFGDRRFGDGLHFGFHIFVDQIFIGTRFCRRITNFGKVNLAFYLYYQLKI